MKRQPVFSHFPEYLMCRLAKIYSDSISESSAETEPAWKKAGESPGLQIWRIVVNIISFSILPCGW